MHSLLLHLLLGFLAAWPGAAVPGDLLAASDFISDEQPFVQDWVLSYGVPGLANKADATAAASVAMAREVGGGAGEGLKGVDTGNQKWYFTSPASFFAFDTTAAYNGVMQWRLQSLSWLGAFMTPAAAAPPPPDVVLSCKPKSLSLMAHGIVTDRFGGSIFSLSLNETGNWFFLKPSVSAQGSIMRKQPTRAEFLECLAGLQSVSVRGGYYTGAEKTVLKHVKIFEGAVDASPSNASASGSYLSSSGASSSVGMEYRVQFKRPGTCLLADRIATAQDAATNFCPQPVGPWPGTDDLVYPRGPWLKAPFVQSLAFKALPPICTSARLVLGVVGRVSQRLTLGPNNYVTVYGGVGSRTPLGKLFNNQNALLNEERQRFELWDALAVSGSHMAGLTAGGGQVVFTLHSAPGVQFEFKIVSAELSWKQGTCMSMLLTSTALLRDAAFKGSWSDEAAQALSPDVVEMTFRMPQAVASKAASDGALQLMAEGDTGPYNYIEVTDTSNYPFGSMFLDQQVTSESDVIWVGRARAFSPSSAVVFFDGITLSQDRMVGAFLRVPELLESGGGQERKIAAWDIATGTATLESAFDARAMPTPQSKLEIVRVAYFALQGNGAAAVRVPLTLRTEWIPLPRSLASSSMNGHLTLRLNARSFASPISKIRVPLARVVFPLSDGYINALRPGSSHVLGVALSRPSYEIFRFTPPYKLPLGPATIIAEIFFQNHEQHVTRTPLNTLTERSDAVDVGAAMGLGQGLPLAPQQLYPHGYGAIRVLAGDRGETVGFFLAEDYSQYEPSAPFVSHVHVSQTTVAALVAQGDLHFTLVIPPGVGVIRVHSLAISYPA